MRKPREEELDMRTVLTQPPPMRYQVNANEMYEVRVEVLRRHESDGNCRKLHVLHSRDGGHTWRAVRLTRNWRKHWWAIFKLGWGGTWFPPWPIDIQKVYLKDNKLCISYSSPDEQGLQGQTYVWEAQYEPQIDRWNIALLKEEH